ncbi:MAG: endopeptidase La [Desulfobacterales bacterium]|nr:endopeptidase La [Desulfobacterales bacterium]MCP4164078.1 endopeptidase La [Deltaproteobacteria bacterium]
MINLPKIFKSDSTLIMPLLPLRDIVVYPHMVAPLFVGRDKSIAALSRAMQKDKTIFLSTQNNATIDEPGESDIYTTGTIGTILQLLRLPDGTVKALIEGKQRAKIENFLDEEEAFLVELSQVDEGEFEQDSESEALVRAITDIFKEYAKINKSISKDVVNNILTITNSYQFADTISAHVPFKIKEKQQLLETVGVSNRLALLLKFLKNESEIYSMGQKIKGRVQSQISKSQKNYYLNEQMRAIKKEMGGADSDDDMGELEERINAKKMSEEAEEKVRSEFKKLKMMSPMSAEANVVRNYIDWMLDLPWFETSELKLDLNDAEKILNEDHYGLKKPKERILEYLAVQTLVKKIRGPILCLVGPPGVGKTSLAKSVARATDREFIRLSLGGVRDEAEIRGHRRTYVGAMPGKIIQNLKKAKVNNPVFCLDEVDKMTTDFRGDPSAALLEVLDPEQNNTFNDHFLDCDYDLSEILFITTANTLHDIPLPLQDRMEIINISGYTEYEKYNIGKDFLVPKLIEMNGLNVESINFSKKSIYNIIQRYTREAGVRNLERELSSVCRKIAYDIVKKKNEESSVNVSVKTIQKFLGQPKFRHGQVEEKDQIGIVTGLAWTQFGGELLSVETVVMPGKGELIVTGKLGDVMKESARAAVSYVRSRSDEFSIESDFYKKYDLHIHIPEGAIPKDGPSAGITMCTAILSALTKRPVKRNVAMTGEITLRGRVLPIGGLKEKLLAAHRGGIEKIIIPIENERDVKEIPPSITKHFEIIPVEHLDDVFLSALVIKDDENIFDTALKQ